MKTFLEKNDIWALVLQLLENVTVIARIVTSMHHEIVKNMTLICVRII